LQVFANLTSLQIRFDLYLFGRVAHNSWKIYFRNENYKAFCDFFHKLTRKNTAYARKKTIDWNVCGAEQIFDSYFRANKIKTQEKLVFCFELQSSRTIHQ
jgi:hypothetical protein